MPDGWVRSAPKEQQPPKSHKNSHNNFVVMPYFPISPTRQLPSHIPGITLTKESREKIQAFQALTDANEIADRASRMYNETTLSDLESAVQSAFQAKLHAEALLKSKREELLKTMDLETLYALAGNLGIADTILQKSTSNPYLADPVGGAVLEQIWEMETGMEHEEDPDSVFTNNNYRKILESLANQTHRDRPSLPCSLDEALRYVADIPPVFTEADLNRVFQDLLRVVPIRTVDEKRIQSELRKFASEAAVNQSAEEITNSGLIGAAKNESVKYQKLIRDAHNELTKSEKFREAFSLDAKVPNMVKFEADKNYTRYWNKPKPVDTEDRLAWLAEHFSQFWIKFGQEYTDRLTLKSSDKKSGIEGMRKGVQNRELVTWISRTEEFLSFLREVNYEQKSNLSNELVNIANVYGEKLTQSKPDGYKKQQTIEKTITFLVVICRCVTKPDSPALGLEMLNQLESASQNLIKEAKEVSKITESSLGNKNKRPTKAGKTYKSVTEQTMLECCNKLRLALGGDALQHHSPKAFRKSSAKKTAKDQTKARRCE